MIPPPYNIPPRPNILEWTRSQITARSVYSRPRNTYPILSRSEEAECVCNGRHSSVLERSAVCPGRFGRIPQGKSSGGGDDDSAGSWGGGRTQPSREAVEQEDWRIIYLIKTPEDQIGVISGLIENIHRNRFISHHFALI